MSHELQLTTDDEDITLPIGRHPDGTLTFEGGTATVDDESVARAIDDTYPNIEYVGGDAGDTDAGGDPGAFDAGEFVDRTPMSDVVEDIESGDYDTHLEAIDEAAEREGVKDAVKARQEDGE